MELESQVLFLGLLEHGYRWYASKPVGAYHGVVVVQATKTGAEGRPA